MLYIYICLLPHAQHLSLVTADQNLTIRMPCQRQYGRAAKKFVKDQTIKAIMTDFNANLNMPTLNILISQSRFAEMSPLNVQKRTLFKTSAKPSLQN